MSTLLAIFRFEVGYYFRRISTYVYFGIFFALSVLLMAAIGGAFNSVSVGFGGGGGNVAVNSPWALFNLVSGVSLFGIIVTAALLGHSAQRDFETGAFPLFFTHSCVWVYFASCGRISLSRSCARFKILGNWGESRVSP